MLILYGYIRQKVAKQSWYQGKMVSWKRKQTKEERELGVMGFKRRTGEPDRA